MTVHGITRKQRQLLGFIAAHIAEFGSSPTFEEMAREMGVKSRSGVAKIVDALELRGHITRLPHKAGSIRIVESDTVRTAVRLRIEERNAA